MAYGYNPVDEEDDAQGQKQSGTGTPFQSSAMGGRAGPAPAAASVPPQQAPAKPGSQSTGFVNLSTMLGLNQHTIDGQKAAWDKQQNSFNTAATSATD